MEKLTLIIAVASTVLSLGLIKVLKVFIKETKEAVKAYENAVEDNRITEEEEKIIAKEAVEALSAGLNLWFAIRKAFGFVKEKIKSKK